ncbi:AAA family ATPase [Sinorhizobium saheli]|uniref:Endonuclease GajA/Old nuclease/RecF-like AAA domain-containing protein n=1 Tax=Sinorhizobium saheli TaxID=36856 RepID=A0A178YG64_SINSA|nr:AAA family ATPase [Sinorhizobium saheli]MQW88218.1 AAA family ATPase [Sinorhizobium saheli]OAP45835.1 hypothetical protein ATB98_04010 [Sinorhizobium saheli]
MTAKYVDTITVKEFLGQKDIFVKFDQSINFIIGLNGTGKTTFINLIRASLHGDSRSLKEIDFSEVLITFHPISGKSKPTLLIRRKHDIPRAAVVYQYKASARSEPIEFVATPENRPSLHNWNLAFLPFTGDDDEQERSPIAEFLPKTIWLPLHRGLLSQKGTIADNKNPVDQKISQLITTTTKYLSSLDGIYAKKIEEFQQNYFLSLLNATVEKLDEASQLDLNEEQISLEQIFREFFKDNTKYKNSIKNHFDRAKRSISHFSEEKPLRYNDFIAISDTIRLHKLVENWNDLQKDKDETFSPKTKFSNLLNNLLVNKSFRFDERNQPLFHANNKKIDIANLSSGEKQLFIMLSTSLIQENTPFIYLADEPELSLHIEWQRKLVGNLRNLNPHAQIIFATHSPDIVAGNQRQVIRMESIIESLRR